MDINLQPSATEEPLITLVRKYGLAIAVVLASFFVWTVLEPLNGESTLPQLLLGGVAIGAAVTGFRGGLVATICAVLLTVYTLNTEIVYDVQHLLPMGLLAVEGTIISFVIYRLRVARQRTERTLDENLERFNVALQYANISLYTNDSDLRYTWIHNPHPGFQPERMLGKRDDELLPSQDVTELVEVKQQVLATGQGVQRQIKTTINGRDYAFAVNVEPHYDRQGKLEGVVVATMDVTESEQMRTALQDSEEKFRVVLKNSPITVSQVDRQLRYTWSYNSHPAFEGGRLIGKRADEVYQGEGVDRFMALKREVLQTGIGQRERITFDIAGESETYDITVEPLRDATGGVAGLTIASLDVTEYEQVQAQLRESEELRRLALDAAEMGTWTNSPDGEIIAWDEQTRRIFGVGADEEINLEKGLSIIHPDDRPKAIEAFERAAAPGEDSNYAEENRILWPDGSVHWVAIKGKVFTPVHDAAGQGTRLVGVVIDITERKEREHILQQQNEMLTQIVDSLPVMITMYESNTRSLYLNDAFTRLLGWRTEDLDTIDLLAEVYPDPDYRVMVRDYMQSLEPGWREFDVKARDGSIVTSEWANIRLSDGRQVGIGIDIRERKRAQQRAQLLQNMAAGFASAMSQQELTDIIIEQGTDALGAAGMVIALLTEDETQLEIVEAMGYPHWVVEKWRNIPLDHPTAPLAVAVRERTQLWLRNAQERDQMIPPPGYPTQAEKHEAWAVLPFDINRKVIGAISLGYDQPQVFDDAERTFLITLTDYFGHALERVQLSEQLRDLATLEERQRISRDLHDSVKQVIFASSTIAQTLPNLWQSKPERAKTYTEEVVHLNRAALAEMQTLLLEMRPEAIVETPFMTLINNICQALRGRMEIELDIHYDGPQELYLPDDVHVAIYRLAQEAVNNVAKHSQATALHVDCISDDGVLRLVIRDNGVGFDIKRAFIGFGLNTMQERAQAVGAALNISSAEGEGTEITITWQPQPEAEL